MFNETFQFIESHPLTVQIISVIIGALVALVIALFAPQAIQARIENKKHFQQKLNEHYTKLNIDIFKPLSKDLFVSHNGVSFSEVEQLTLEFKPEMNTLLEKGLLHLKHDYLGFDKEINEFQRDVDNFNNKLSLFYGSLDTKIKQEFSDSIEVDDSFEFARKDNVLGIKSVKNVILVCISRHLKSISQYDKNLIKNSTYHAIKEYQNSIAQSFYQGRIPFLIFGYTIMNVSFKSSTEINQNKQKVDDIINHLCEIISREDVFIPLRNLLTEHDLLLLRGNKFSNKIKKISVSIDNSRYTTITSCCPKKSSSKLFCIA